MRAGRNPTSIRMAPGTYWYVPKHVRRTVRPNWGLCQCVRVLHLQLHARRPQIACGSCTTAQYVPLT